MVLIVKVWILFYFIFFDHNFYLRCFYELDVNECLTNNRGCDINAVCTNIIGSFSCTCKTGYEGNGFNCEGIVFFSILISFSFFFPSLSLIIGFLILDIDECLANNGECNEHEECLNIIGSRECYCINGYQKDGETCIGMSFFSLHFYSNDLIKCRYWWMFGK